MVDLKEFIKRLNGLEYFARKVATELLFKKGQEIVQANNAELIKGLNTEGKIIQTGYSKGYAKKRKKAGLQTSYVDLYFTGKFQSSSKPVKVVEGLDIESGVKYEKYLRERYENIRGLNVKQSEQYVAKIADELVIELKKYLVV